MTASTNLRAVAALAAAVTLLTGCTSASPDDGPAPTTSDTAVGTETGTPTDATSDPDAATSAPGNAPRLQPDPGTTALVLMDGWSLRAAGATTIDAVVDGNVAQLDFTAVTGDQLAGLLDTHPQLVEALIGRMVDGATTVACSSDGCLLGGEPTAQGDGTECAEDICVTDGRRLDVGAVAALASAPDVPGYGPVYASWGVNALAYVATVDVADASSLSVAHDTERMDLPLSAHQDAFDDAESAGDDADPLATGFGQDVHLVAYGLGELFRPSAAWQTAHNAPFMLPAAPPAPAVRDEAAALGGLPLMGGVGTAREAAEGLTDGQLTYLTSPTTGCGVGLQCVPTSTVQGQVTVAATDTVTVCGRDTETLAIVTDATVTFDMDGTVHQLGLWNGKQPEEFAGHTGGFFSGQPELVGDGTRMRVLAVHVLQGGGTVHDVSGMVYQLGVDDPAVAERDVTPSEVVATTGTWTVC